jgi:capsular exopolysaccharide synthesis family protein
MDLRDYLRLLRRSWLIALVTVLACVSAGIGYTFTATKVYEATAQIFVATSSAGDASQLAQGNTFTQARVQSYTSIATSPAVTTAVVQSLALHVTADELTSKITSDAPLNKVVINIHLTDRSPEEAAVLANAVATQFSAVVEGMERTNAAVRSPVKLTVTKPAAVPSQPVKPNRTLNIALSLLAGIVLALGLVALRAALENDFKNPADLQAALDVPVLGVIAKDKKLAGAEIAFRGEPHGRRAEAFRHLRTNLQFIEVDTPPRVIAICSSLPREGKTLTALNLAASIAEAGHRVCLVEADLRRPTISAILGLVGEVGFTSVLAGSVSVRDAIQNAGQNLAVLPSGAVPPNPGELLASARAREIIDQIAMLADYVIIDTAPLLPVADGAEVATMAQATMLVVRAGKTSRDEVSRAVASLARVEVTPVGAILTMAPAKLAGADYYYYYGSGYASRESESIRDSDFDATSAVR